MCRERCIKFFYKISGICIESTYDILWNKFKVLEKDEFNPDIIIKIGTPRWYCGIEVHGKIEKKSYILKNKTDCISINSTWTIGTVFQRLSPESLDLFLLQMFYAQAVKQNMILLHSSLIDWKGRGLMFLGPSGIGKTTQAELWNQYRDALIINGDAVFVQETPTPSLAGAPPGMGLLLTVRIPASPWPPWWS